MKTYALITAAVSLATVACSEEKAGSPTVENNGVTIAQELTIDQVLAPCDIENWSGSSKDRIIEDYLSRPNVKILTVIPVSASNYAEGSCLWTFERSTKISLDDIAQSRDMASKDLSVYLRQFWAQCDLRKAEETEAVKEERALYAGQGFALAALTPKTDENGKTTGCNYTFAKR